MKKGMVGLIALALLVVGSSAAFAGTFVTVTSVQAVPEYASNATGSTGTITATTVDKADMGQWQDGAGNWWDIEKSYEARYWLIGYTPSLTAAQEAAMRASGWADHSTNRLHYGSSNVLDTSPRTLSQSFPTAGWPDGEYPMGVMIVWVHVRTSKPTWPGLNTYEEKSAVPALKIDGTGPVANAGSDVISLEGKIVQLTGINSTDSGSGVATYSWADSIGNPIGAGGIDPTANVTVTKGMNDLFTLTVTDALGNVGDDDVLVTDILDEITNAVIDNLPPGLSNIIKRGGVGN